MFVLSVKLYARDKNQIKKTNNIRQRIKIIYRRGKQWL